jgi:hypothetical protein
MKTKRFRVWVLLSLFCLAAACLSVEKMESPPSPTEPTQGGEAAQTVALVADKDRAGMTEAEKPTDQTAADGQVPPPNLAVRGRKLIREGRVELQVKELEPARAKLEAMVKSAGGFVADVRFNRYTGSSQMELTLRLPAEGFESFVKSLAALGRIENEETNTQDVTEQWTDLHRRIETNEKLAARLEELIQSKSYQFKDLLEVERELARLRLDTERLQGALHAMDDRITLSALHVVMRQERLQKIAPPDSVFAPLLNAIENAGPQFQGSVRLMMKFAGGVVTLVVIVLPWVVAFFVLLAVLWLVIKRRQGKKTRGEETRK